VDDTAEEGSGPGQPRDGGSGAQPPPSATGTAKKWHATQSAPVLIDRYERLMAGSLTWNLPRMVPHQADTPGPMTGPRTHRAEEWHLSATTGAQCGRDNRRHALD